MNRSARRILTASIMLAAASMMAGTAHASLLVEQWQGGGAGSNGLSGVDSVIASRLPSISQSYTIIDFTDDPAGFVGEIPGSSQWPLAVSLGQSGSGATANNDFAARISGLLTISIADTYAFRTYSDDGVRLRVGGATVISDNGYHPEQINNGSLFLNPGSYLIDLIFFEGGGEASLEFTMARGNGAFGLVGTLAGTSTQVQAVPEPSTWAAGIIVAGMVTGTFWRARRRS